MVSNKARKRGDALLTMIRLDYAKYDLFELPPIPYDALMGNTNRYVIIQKETFRVRFKLSTFCLI